jgi:protein TonB
VTSTPPSLPSGGGTVVVVDDFESAADEARLAARAGLPSVVGRWRAHTGTPLAPLDADASEMALYFPQPWKVLLLVGSEGGENPTAGFFTWMNGALVSKCAREFPFHSGALLAASAPLVEGPQRSRPLELREGHGWRASAVSAIVAAMALAGGMWYWHRPDSPGVAKQPAAALAPSQPPALSAGVHIPQPAPQINVQPAPQINVPLPDLPRPSAMPRPAYTARPRPSRTTDAKTFRPETRRQSRDRDAEDIAEPVTRHFFRPAAAQPAPVAAAKPAGTAQRAQAPGPPHKATVTIAEARPATSARGTFLPPLPVLAARPEVRGGCPCDTPVDIRVHVDDTGAVTAVEPTPGTPENELTAAALAAARQWSFVAARAGTRKVASDVVLRFRFPVGAESYVSRK